MDQTNSNVLGGVPMTPHGVKHQKAIQFNPLSACTIVRDILRGFFKSFGDSFNNGYVWSSDEKESKIVISTVNDLNRKTPVGQVPRILIGRGAIQSGVMSLSGDMETQEFTGVGGDKVTYHRQDLDGQISIIVEAEHEGSCEVIAETVRRYLVWSRGLIEATFGYQRFAHTMMISECQLDQEDKEKFKIQLSIPYRIEDRWKSAEFQMRLKQVFFDVISS